MDDELPTPEEILVTHEVVVERWDLTHAGVRTRAPKLKFKRIISNIREYDGIYLRAAHLLRDITTGHHFEDGNKRTAWLTTRKYLKGHGETPAESGPSAERVMRRIRRFTPSELEIWLETGDIDEGRLPDR